MSSLSFLLSLDSDELTEAIAVTVRSGKLLPKMPTTTESGSGLDGLRGLRSLGLLSNNVSHTNLPLGKFVNLLRCTRESGSAPRTKNGPCIGICGHGRTAKETLHLDLRTGLLV